MNMLPTVEDILAISMVLKAQCATLHFIFWQKFKQKVHMCVFSLTKSPKINNCCVICLHKHLYLHKEVVCSFISLIAVHHLMVTADTIALIATLHLILMCIIFLQYVF